MQCPKWAPANGYEWIGQGRVDCVMSQVKEGWPVLCRRSKKGGLCFVAIDGMCLLCIQADIDLNYGLYLRFLWLKLEGLKLAIN